MSFEHPYLKRTVAAIAAIVAFSLPLFATESEPSADLTDELALLQELSQADQAEARRLDRQLRALWDKSGSASMDLLLKRGRDALETGDGRAAIEHLTALTDHAPGFAEGWHVRAMAYFEAGLYGPAVADLERALSLNPNHFNAMIGLAAILETVGRPEQAYEVYGRAQAIHPHHEDVTKALDRLAPQVRGKSL